MPSVDLLLHDVTPRTREILRTQCRQDRFQPGEDLLAWGIAPDRLHRIVEGRAKIWRPGADGGSVLLFFLHPGDTAGLVPICRNRTAVANVTAGDAVVTASWPTATILALLRDDRQMAANALAIVSRLVELLALRIEDLTSGRADQQLARALLRLAGEDGEWGDSHEATVAVTRQDLADMTRSTLHTASRTLSAWEGRRLVRSSRGRVTITDPAALAAIAGLAA